MRFAEGRADLVFVSPAEAPPGVCFLLGVDADGVAYFGVDAPLDQASPWTGQRAPDGAAVRPASLRQVGSLLGDRDAGLLTHAIALANWHDTHTHCPICGTPTTVNPGGHSTTCPNDGTEHFPRTDPAVIMLVTDPADRCLLAHNKAWPQRRVSILAGFVDPGESAEHAVVREVSEETGIAVGRVTYLGSQPWPMPRSLMLGFHALAEGWPAHPRRRRRDRRSALVHPRGTPGKPPGARAGPAAPGFDRPPDYRSLVRRRAPGRRQL